MLGQMFARGSPVIEDQTVLIFEFEKDELNRVATLQ